MFKINKKYTFKSVCDSSCIWSLTVLAITEKTVKILIDGEVKNLKIYKSIDGDFIRPFGKYSMAPICRA